MMHTTSDLLQLPEKVVAGTTLRHQFREHGYVLLRQLLTPAGLLTLQEELQRLETVATRRDFEMQCMNNSPRHMTTVGGHIIEHESELIPALYADPMLVEVLRAITELPLMSVEDALERHVANFLHRPGDTHGAHFDDFPVAMILFVEAPADPEAGGVLEYVPNTDDLTSVDTDLVRRAFHEAGDAYVLRSDTTAHRVTALSRDARRVVLNFAYATPESCSMTTDSASLLYG